MAQRLQTMVWQFIGKKLDVKLPCDPAIPPLGIVPKELKDVMQTDIYTPVFTAALRARAKRWKQHKRPWVDRQMNEK